MQFINLSIYINIVYNTYINNSLLEICLMYIDKKFTHDLLFSIDESIIQEILII